MGPAEPVSEVRLAHEILAREFTDRYLRRSGFSRIAYSVPYDRSDPLCDYDTTWWPARPNRWSAPVGKAILGRSHRLTGREIDTKFVAPFFARADSITAVLRDYPVALVSGHDIDLQAALALLAACIGIADATGHGNRQQVLEQTIGIAHGIATRGLAPIAVGKPWAPGRLTFLRLQQLVVNPHLSFPINREMIASGIPRNFRKRYNKQLRAEAVAAAHAPTDHPLGYRTLWSMSPGGTPDMRGEGEHAGRLLTKSIEPATVQLFREMGCGLLPVYTSFGRGKGPTVVELGAIVPPDEADGSALRTLMADIAEFRRAHGEPHVFYEGEV